MFTQRFMHKGLRRESGCRTQPCDRPCWVCRASLRREAQTAAPSARSETPHRRKLQKQTCSHFSATSRSHRCYSKNTSSTSWDWVGFRYGAACNESATGLQHISNLDQWNSITRAARLRQIEICLDPVVHEGRRRMNADPGSDAGKNKSGWGEGTPVCLEQRLRAPATLDDVR